VDRYHHLHRRPRPPASPKRTVHEQSRRGEAADVPRSCEPGAAVDAVSEVQCDAHAGSVELPPQSDAQVCVREGCEPEAEFQSSASSSSTSASSASAGQATNASADQDEM
jgi:hypothetical protein